MPDDAANGQSSDAAGNGQSSDAAGNGQNAEDAAGAQSPQNEADHQAPAWGSMFSLGWLMAGLFDAPQNESEAPSSGQSLSHLPTVTELSEGEQMDLAFTELDDLLGGPQGSSQSVRAAWAAGQPGGYADAVLALHVANLGHFAEDLEQLGAYQLGVALRDMCGLLDSPLSHPAADEQSAQFLQIFDRRRLATVQMWLAQAGGALPAESAATVSRSLQKGSRKAVQGLIQP
jgi:hypothetical protein